MEVASKHLTQAHGLEMKCGRRDGKSGWLRAHMDHDVTFQSWMAHDIHHSWLVVVAEGKDIGRESSGAMLGQVPIFPAEPALHIAVLDRRL